MLNSKKELIVSLFMKFMAKIGMMNISKKMRARSSQGFIAERIIKRSIYAMINGSAFKNIKNPSFISFPKLNVGNFLNLPLQNS